jgi:23S rRNA (adenine2503-C2)-methyltransferase
MNEVMDAPAVSLARYDTENVREVLLQLKQPRYRTQQLLEWIWAKDAQSYDEMTSIPRAIRADLAELLPLVRADIVQRQVSRDGTRKYLMQFNDGHQVEVVGLPSENRLTVCASTQIGCAMGCTFCATAQGGLVRNLTSAEIVDTVVLVARDFKSRVSSVVMMGQGEPFANYDATLEALRILNAPWGLNIGARHLTVSTCGLIAGIKRFAAEPEQFTLAVSLHSAFQSKRDKIMPGVSTQTLYELRDALIGYYEKTGRRPSLEYALVAGYSDTSEEIDALGMFASAIGAHVNLIPLNAWEATARLQPTTAPRIREITTLLRNRYGIEATQRVRRGADIDAACGQLRQRSRL